jgi:hypothetical protein
MASQEPMRLGRNHPSTVVAACTGEDHAPDQRALGLDSASNPQDVLAAEFVVPSVPQQPSGAFYPEHRFEPKAYRADLFEQLVRMMEVRGGEELRLASRVEVASRPQIAVYHRLEVGFCERSRDEAIQERSEAGDRSNDDQSLGANDTAGLR